MASDKKDDVTQDLLEWFSSHIKTIIVIFIFAVAGVFTAFFFLRGKDSLAAWGQSGDFIGGWLNPIVAIANLAFLVYLTLLIKHRDDNAHEKALVAQKMISLNQFRHDAYTQLFRELKNIEKDTKTLDEEYHAIENVSNFLDDFSTYYSYLFEGNAFNNNVLELKLALLNFLEEVENINDGSSDKDPSILLSDSDPTHEKFRQFHKVLIDSRDELISKMQRIILSIDDPLRIL